MRILHISDIHGEKKYISRISGEITNSHLVAVTGDISDNGDCGEAEEIIGLIERHNRNILAVHGNWDGDDIQQFLKGRGYNLHGSGRIIEGIGFFGAGGSGPTPFGSPSEYTDDDFLEYLQEGYNMIRGAEKKVLLCHAPPYKTRDRTFLGMRGGSAGIRRFIERNSADLCLAGHIHEASGIDSLNGCIVANPGAFKKGRYIKVNIEVNQKFTRENVELLR